MRALWRSAGRGTMRRIHERLFRLLALAFALTLLAGACSGDDEAAEDGDGRKSTDGTDTGGDSAFLREQHILTTGAPYEIQAINAMRYWQDHGGEGQSACVAYLNEPYFQVGLDGVEYAAAQMGFEVAEVVVLGQGTQDWATPIQALQGCDMVYLASTSVETRGLLGAAAMAQFAPQWIGQAPTFAGSLVASPLGGYLQENFWLAAEGPAWGDESVEGMAQVLRHVQRYVPDQQPELLLSLGYARAWAVHQVLEKAVEMGDLSRPSIVEAMNSIDTLEFGGLLGDYQYGPPDEREPPRCSTIFQIDPDVPGGLSALSDVNFTSDAAESYRFEQ
ncbi:MAG TPA: ABC transporter substrate-binding protein [Acidimicrobiales bacterium]